MSVMAYSFRACLVPFVPLITLLCARWNLTLSCMATVMFATAIPLSRSSLLASVFLSADLGITPEIREDHASYIANWLTVLKNDKRAIFTAASHAQKAVDYLHGLQPPQS